MSSLYSQNESFNSIKTVEVPKEKPNEPVNAGLRGVAAVAANSPSESSPTESNIDPLNNPFAQGNRKRSRTHNQVFGSLLKERREVIDVQIVGGGVWTFFPDLQVADHDISNLLFSFGPYRISRKEGNAAKSAMSLVYNERQQVLGVLTGRLVIKVRDLIDVNSIAREYELKLDNVSTGIRTAYMTAVQDEHYAKINSILKSDARVERFYFEVVKTDWVKN